MRLKISALLGAATLALALAVPAFAFDCSVAKKPPTAGAVGIVDANDVFTPLKSNPGTEERPHGGFIVFTDGEITVSTFLHAPDGVLPPVRPGGPQDRRGDEVLGRDELDRRALAVELRIEEPGQLGVVVGGWPGGFVAHVGTSALYGRWPPVRSSSVIWSTRCW